jgi:transcriptional regulator GlxA family with amidase domain
MLPNRQHLTATTITMPATRFAFLLYSGVEPIDLAALGVVSMARRVAPGLSCATVARRPGEVVLASGLRVVADHGFDDCPAADVLIVPGGPGWREAAADDATLAFLRARSRAVTTVSLCTGAMLLAAAGLLDGRAATTKREVVEPEPVPLDELARRHPAVDVRAALVVDHGDVVTGGGVSLCIDTALHVLARRLDATAIAALERILEYGAAADANRRRLPVVHAD